MITMSSSLSVVSQITHWQQKIWEKWWNLVTGWHNNNNLVKYFMYTMIKRGEEGLLCHDLCTSVLPCRSCCLVQKNIS